MERECVNNVLRKKEKVRMFDSKRNVWTRAMSLVLCGCVLGSSLAGAGDVLITIKGSKFDVPGQNSLVAWSGRGDSVRADLAKVENNCAPVVVSVPCAGEYYLWARTRTGGSGVTQYNVVIDERILTKEFGDFERDTTKWERFGPIRLAKGEHKLELNKIGNGAVWCRGIVLTSDKNYAPPTNTAS